MPPVLSPRYWGGHLLALVLLAAAVGLGLWQFDAWHQRRDAAATDLTKLAPVPLDQVIGPDAPFPGRKVGVPVTVAGVWVPGGTLYVSDRINDGVSGYWVVTPVAVGAAADASTDSAVPVVRGWVKEIADAPAVPTGDVSLVGLLQPPEGTGAVDDDPTDDVLPQLRIADVIQHVHQDLYGAYVTETRDQPGTSGMDLADPEQLPDAGTFTALRNFLYAIEWWIFGAFAVFVWWRWVGDVNHPEEPAEQDAPDDRLPVA